MSIFYPEEERRNDEKDLRLERKELRILRELLHVTEQNQAILLQILGRLPAPPTLTTIKLRFGGTTMPQGPVTIAVGQTVTASVLGFDQNGAPFTGPIPTPSFAIDNSAVATIDPVSGLTTGVSGGVANATATVVSAEGVTLTDTETVTVTAVTPVLSSIKISFD